MKKVLIVGAGISGISLSRMLKGHFEVKVLERAATAGGLIKCERINGNLFHRVGGHVFNSRNQSVLDWFWKHFDRDTEFINARRNARILMNDSYIGYPLEDYLYQLPENHVRAIIKDLVNMLSGECQVKAPDNFKDFLINSFGKSLYDLYFGPYNAKIWNTDISQVPLEWLDGKLPMPSKAAILINNILRKEESEMVHASFFYPKKDGSQFIINRLAEAQDIEVNYGVNNIRQTNNGLIVNGEMETDHIVYCGDIRQLHAIVEIDDAALQQSFIAVKDLPSNGTSNVLCNTDANDISWLYLPEEKFKAHRIIYTGNFSETNNEPHGRKTCVVEFSGKQDEAGMRKELKLLPGNLEPIAFNYEPNSYIIHTKETRNQVAAIKKALQPYNIFLLGRFAEWEYYNMDKCIERAMELSKQLQS